MWARRARANWDVLWPHVAGKDCLMLGAMLALGGINSLMLRKYSPGETIPRLRRLVEAEVGIGLTILLTAASMTSQPPAVDLPDDTVQPCHTSVQRFKPEWPFETPNTTVTSRLASRDRSSPRPIPRDRRSWLIPAKAWPVVDTEDRADMRWSEYNHHWMGLIVLGMGMLAFLARHRQSSPGRSTGHC